MDSEYKARRDEIDQTINKVAQICLDTGVTPDDIADLIMKCMVEIAEQTATGNLSRDEASKVTGLVPRQARARMARADEIRDRIIRSNYENGLVKRSYDLTNKLEKGQFYTFAEFQKLIKGPSAEITEAIINHYLKRGVLRKVGSQFEVIKGLFDYAESNRQRKDLRERALGLFPEGCIPKRADFFQPYTGHFNTREIKTLRKHLMPQEIEKSLGGLPRMLLDYTNSVENNSPALKGKINAGLVAALVPANLGQDTEELFTAALDRYWDPKILFFCARGILDQVHSETFFTTDLPEILESEIAPKFKVHKGGDVERDREEYRFIVIGKRPQFARIQENKK